MCPHLDAVSTGPPPFLHWSPMHEGKRPVACLESQGVHAASPCQAGALGVWCAREAERCVCVPVRTSQAISSSLPPRLRLAPSSTATGGCTQGGHVGEWNIAGRGARCVLHAAAYAQRMLEAVAGMPCSASHEPLGSGTLGYSRLTQWSATAATQPLCPVQCRFEAVAYSGPFVV